MFTLTKWFSFDASHTLTEHDGKCANLHGHTWKLGIVVTGVEVTPTGPQTGMVRDYGRIAQVVRERVLPRLDHQHLNDTLPCYPTSENVARWVFDTLQPIMKDMAAVVVCETPDSSCEYRPFLS